MKQFAIIGLGRFGVSLAKALMNEGFEVLAVDKEREIVQEASEYVTQAVQLDATDEKALRAVGIKDVDMAIVSIGQDIQASVMVTMLLKEIGVKEIIAKTITDMHGKILRQLGVSKVVFPERDMGERLAKSLVSPDWKEQMEIFPGYSIVEIKAPDKFVGKTLSQLDIRKKYDISVIAVKKKIPMVDDKGEANIKEELNALPRADDIIEENDMMILIANKKSFEEFKKMSKE